jgi:hypothetical protein
MDPPQQPGVVELAKVSPDRVGGDSQLGRQIGRQHPPLRAQQLQDQGTPLVRQHCLNCTRSCTFLHDRAQTGAT